MEKKKGYYADGWHDVNDNFRFFVEGGCIVRGVQSGNTVYPYRYDRKLDCLSSISPRAYYGVLNTISWH